MRFTVVPPVWQEPWFIGLVAVAVGIIAYQASRIVVRDRQLRVSSAALADALNDLFESSRKMQAANRQLEDTLSRLKEAQNQLILQEKMASLGSLAAGVAHEINTPIGAINSATDVLRRGIDRIVQALDRAESLDAVRNNPRFQKTLDLLAENNRIAAVAGQRIAWIVRSLRNFARLDESDFQEADLHEGLNSTLALLHHQLRDRIRVVKNFGDIPSIRCYPNRLNQVFMNLLVNAVQAIEGEGEITLTTWQQNGRVHVAVKDTGVGIPAENLDKIFNPGFTTKGVGVGTGLGLAICYQIVRDHRGEIGLESEVGRGSTFTVILPSDLSAPGPAQNRKPAGS